MPRSPVKPISRPSLHSSASVCCASSPLYLTHTRSIAARPYACATVTMDARAKSISRREGVRMSRDAAQ